MSEHAMDWISRARHLQPPIDQMEMVDQITSHFSYNVSLALRGLRTITTNELIRQLTYLQRTNAPQNNHCNNNIIQTIILVSTLNNKILILIHPALNIKTDIPPVITTKIEHNIKTITMLNHPLHQTMPRHLRETSFD